MLRAVKAPWLVLFLMIPLPAIIFNEIAFPLQVLASQSACSLLDLLRVPVLREGNIIILPSMSLDIVEACSGLRSLMSLITVATFFGLFFERKVWMRCLLVLFAIPVAVFANALRIVISALLAQYVQPSARRGFLPRVFRIPALPAFFCGNHYISHFGHATGAEASGNMKLSAKILVSVFAIGNLIDCHIWTPARSRPRRGSPAAQQLERLSARARGLAR